MSKRRRTSSFTSRGIDEDDDSQPPSEPTRKKKKIDPSDIIQQLYDTIRNYKKNDGSLLCDFFIRAPKRRQEPAYYEVVANPMDLLKVQQKIKTDEYEDVDEFIADIELLVSNTKAFYKRTSQEFKDACELWELVQSTKTKLFEDPKLFEDDSKSKTPAKEKKIVKETIKKEPKKNEDTESTSEGSVTYDEELAQCEDLFTVVMTGTAEDGRLLHSVFQLLPSKKLYPKYYEVIDNPIDLRAIARKIQQNKYSSLGEMEKDLIQMCKNATIFNEPGSQIYKDAKALRKLVQTKKVDIELGRYQSPNKGSERIKSKRLRSNNTLSAMIANLKTEEEEAAGDDEEDVVDIDDPDNPCWQLYHTVKSATGTQDGGMIGQLLCEAFLKLPSKRYYPDYYKEIRNPISLAQISKKLQKGQYGTVSEVAGDMNIMFENAKNYNRSDSKLYKDAVKLQKLMQKRVQELLEFDHQYSASDDDSVDEPASKKPKSNSINSGNSTPVHSANRLLTKGKYLDNIPLKKRLYALCKCLMQHICEDGRQPMLMFMEKPSVKLYPEYYDVIERPIDMLTIENNIKNELYRSEEEILADFKLMFRNCRKFNEEGSLIYKDAVKLEKILMDKVKELGPLVDTRTEKEKRAPRIATPLPPKTPRLPRQTTMPTPVAPPTPTTIRLDPVLSNKMRSLYVAIRDYKDKNGRQLSQIFQKLPSKTEYPDYYDIIKKPINIELISQKLKSAQYEGLDDLSSDFILMFDNACKYNEPDSQIYKDALTLQKVILQTKLQLRQDEQSVPDVQAAVQELLLSLFITVYNHQDEEGRCFSDSMQELPEHDEVDGKKVRALSLDLIKRRLDSGQYKRLDLFQEDVFACFQRARNLSRSDSQVFEDSIELQSYFIRQRDELCRNGDLLHSPALNYTLLDLSNTVNAERVLKQAQEIEEEELKPVIKDEPGNLAGTADNALSYNQQVYRIGDFVYAEGKERGMDPIILNIQRLWTNQEGQQMLFGNQYYRPNETYHLPTRKFLEKEVFKTDQNVAIPLNQVLGRCCVLSVKDYFRSKPEGVNENDIYVCESRYASKQRAFKKIKNWPPSLMTGYKLVTRDVPLEPKRVVSVFKQRIEKHKEELTELEEQEKIEEKQKPNVAVGLQNEDGLTYYEQLNAPTCSIKTGDFVYMKADGRTCVAQVDVIWTNSSGSGFFKGPWVLFPTEVPNLPNRMFYKNEVFVSTLEDSHSVNSIINKCVVLEHGEYISCRPTEIPESDVFICESLYDETSRCLSDLPREGLKKYSHTPEVTQDEIYFFRRLINPPKILLADISHTVSTVLTNNNQNENSVDSDLLMEDSLDAPPSVASEDNSQSAFATPMGTRKGRGTGKKLVTGYVLYSGDVRKAIAASNPDANFGEVSRIVGNEWRKLGPSEKAAWEERAARINEETERMKNSNDDPSSPASAQYETIFECQWDNCDWQFEDLTDAIDHAVGDPHGHIWQYFNNLQSQVPSQDVEFQCQWRGCTRTRKTIPPFPSVQRLVRHVREVHMLKNTGRMINIDQKSKNFVPSRKTAAQKAMAAAIPTLPGVPLHATSAVAGVQNHRSTPSPISQNGTGPVLGSNGRINEPLFVTVPPRTQRLLHSEAYIKYIEGLMPDNRNISNWEKQLSASQEAMEAPPDPSRLPVHWLNNRNGNQGNILNALWTLRDFMFRDALGISKHL